ncbi:MAG: sodium:calcium antiporter [Dehalococcoidales bacterium]|nr:sodium:calcium antiporter [Dehalococcoidales bacterium]
MVWLKFAACLVIILFAGSKLARYGDAIAEKAGLGRMWVGLLLLAAVTSMPELVTGVSSVALVKLPDLAVGNLLGSCLFNLLIIAIMDIIYRPAPILSKTSPRQVTAAVISIVLTAVVAGGIFAGGRFPGLAVGWVNAPGIIPLVLYVVGMWWLFRAERAYQPEPTAASMQYRGLSKRTVYLRFALLAAAVIGAGIWLSFIGDEIAATYHWDTSLVGSLFLAITTSMPELVVTIAALRLGAIDMAVADVLGSNMFNLAIITPVDIAYRRGPVLSLVSEVHLVTAAIVMVMTAIVIVGLRFRPQGKRSISWHTAVLIGLYIFGMYRLFIAGTELG